MGGAEVKGLPVADGEDGAIMIPMRTFLLLANLALGAAPIAGERPPAVCVAVDFVFFKTDSARLTLVARQTLDRYVDTLQMSKFPSRVELRGNSDRVGAGGANLRLSRRRAESVRAYLIAKGFPRERIVIEAAGEDKPLVETPDSIPEAQNRYVYLFEHLAPEESARREAIWARIGRPPFIC